MRTFINSNSNFLKINFLIKKTQHTSYIHSLRPYLQPSQYELVEYAITEQKLNVSSSAIEMLIPIAQIISSALEITLQVDDFCQSQLQQLAAASADNEQLTTLAQRWQDCLAVSHPASGHSWAQRHIHQAEVYGASPKIVEFSTLMNRIKSLSPNQQDILDIAQSYKQSWSRFDQIDPIRDEQYHRLPHDAISQLNQWQLGLEESISTWEKIMDKLLSQHPDNEHIRMRRVFNPNNAPSLQWQDQLQQVNNIIQEIKDQGWLDISDINYTINYAQQIQLSKEHLEQIKYALIWLDEQQDYHEYKIWFKQLTESEKRSASQLLTVLQKPETNAALRLAYWREKSMPHFLTDSYWWDQLLAAHHQLSQSNVNSTPLIEEDSNQLQLRHQAGRYILTLRETEERHINAIDLSSILHLTKLSTTQAISQSETLARGIAQINPKLRLYQTKNLNILSFLSENLATKLDSYLADIGAKSIDFQSTKIAIKDSMLFRDRRHIAIVEEQLLSLDNEHIVYQRKLIQALQKSGYLIVSINSKELCQGYTVSEIVDNYIKA